MENESYPYLSFIFSMFWTFWMSKVSPFSMTCSSIRIILSQDIWYYWYSIYDLVYYASTYFSSLILIHTYIHTYIHRYTYIYKYISSYITSLSISLLTSLSLLFPHSPARPEGKRKEGAASWEGLLSLPYHRIELSLWDSTGEDIRG